MPQIYEECDRVVAGFALMRKGYRTQYMSARVIWMRCGDPANAIFLECARPDHRLFDFDSTFVSVMMSEARSLLSLNYLSNSVYASGGHRMYRLSIPQVLCPGKDEEE